ncbi:5439_t:CDS:2, partial [Cetraspora pellucida]
QQVEGLSSQLSEREQEVERMRLESEIRSNLIREQGQKISQQTNQLTSYQNLLRMAEENLKKAQGLIQQKEKQLEQLEKEKNLIGEELSLANSKIQELEATLLGANSKIGQLEARIRELESKEDNLEELERLKKELAEEKQKIQQEKSKQQQEINSLKQELQQTKLREEQLSQKIKELGQKKVVKEVEFGPEKNKPTEEVNNWEREKEQASRERRWLTDKEIDWATARMEKKEQMPGAFPGQETPSKFKILPAHQFHYVRDITSKREKGWELAFKELLKEITDESKELIFIPVNNPNFHWSLLVFEVKGKKFYHYDTLGGANDKYVEPLVRELVGQIQAVRNVKEDYLGKYLIKKYELRQNNGWECGVAVIAIMKRIMELKFKQSLGDRLKYGSFRCGDDLGGFVFGEERKKLRQKYLAELK